MPEEDEYFTIENVEQAEIKIKGSRFIGTASPIKDEADAKEFIQKISGKYFDATHNCFAYIAGFPPHQIVRVNDDGEPSGTAGQPILSVIQGKKLNFICVVVTRYFGGTKLGKGGLIRAYSDCTRQVLQKCEIKRKYILQRFEFSFSYDLTGTVMRTISQFNADIIDAKYDEQTRIIVLVRKSMAKDFKAQLIEVTAGKLNLFE